MTQAGQALSPGETPHGIEVCANMTGHHADVQRTPSSPYSEPDSGNLQVGILENEYRVLPLEVIAGENRLEAIVNQHRARFKVHFGEVSVVLLQILWEMTD